jgi:ankyrin repeat protein
MTFFANQFTRFLLARLYVELLRDKRRKRDVLSTLDQLPKGSAGLNDAYEKAMKQIEEQLPGDRLLGKRAISWITCAQRPLTTKELCHALSIEPGDKTLDSEDVYDIESVVSSCAGLVTIDEERDIIRLVHYTTQEYFEHELLQWNPGAREEIATNCLTYLTFDTFRSGSCGTDTDFERRMEGNVFLDYAARHWAEHVRPVEAAVSELALAFLQNNALVSCTIQIMLVGDYKSRGYSQCYTRSTTGLHLSAGYGLVSLSRLILTAVCEDYLPDIDSKDEDGQTPLLWAAASGREAVVKLLVGTGKVDVNSKDKYGRTPLSRAAAYGKEAVVKLLVGTSKVDVDSKDKYGYTPLLWAAASGHDAVVKLLIGTGKVDINSKDKHGQTPLSQAAAHGREAVVKLLVGTGKVDVDSKDKLGQTPLSQAAAHGREAVVKLLVGTGKVDVDSKDDYGQTPLSRAAVNEHEAIVKLLEQNAP